MLTEVLVKYMKIVHMIDTKFKHVQQ